MPAGLPVEVMAKVPSRYYRLPQYFFTVLTVAHNQWYRPTLARRLRCRSTRHTILGCDYPTSKVLTAIPITLCSTHLTSALLEKAVNVSRAAVPSLISFNEMLRHCCEIQLRIFVTDKSQCRCSSKYYARVRFPYMGPAIFPIFRVRSAF